MGFIKNVRHSNRLDGLLRTLQSNNCVIHEISSISKTIRITAPPPKLMRNAYRVDVNKSGIRQSMLAMQMSGYTLIWNISGQRQ